VDVNDRAAGEKLGGDYYVLAMDDRQIARGARHRRHEH
jgi:hypothetical protein